MNQTTIKRVIKRQFNSIIDEEKKLRIVLDMETNDEHPEALFSGLYTRVEQHLDEIVKLQNRIVALQDIVNPE
jgi:flagellin-specific chaperone FliS